MAVYNGTALIVQIGGTAVSCQTNSSAFNATRDMIETTCKDATGSNKTYIPGEKDITIDVEASYDPTGTLALDDVFDDWDDGTLITWTWGSTAAGETYYTGSGYISDLNPTAPQNDRASYSFTIQVSGGATRAINPT